MKLIIILVVVLCVVQSAYSAPEDKCDKKTEVWTCQIPCTEHNCDKNIVWCDPKLVKQRCVEGCYCIDGLWRNGEKDRCINKKKCPKENPSNYAWRN